MDQPLPFPRTRALLTILLVLCTVVVLPAQAQRNLGLVADHGTQSAHVIDLTTNTLLTTIPLPVGQVGIGVGDVAVSQDGTLGFVTTFADNVFVVDLTLPIPALAAGTNPIPISNPGEDFAVTPDGNYLLTSDGSTPAPISVIDISARSEVDTESLTGLDHISVSICDDGVTVLASSAFEGAVASGVFDPATGTLSATGHALPVSNANNVYCAPGSRSGIVITRFTGLLISFIIGPGGTLTEVDELFLGTNQFGISGVFDTDGTTFYARYQSSALSGTVAGFAFNPVTGEILPGSATPAPVILVAGTLPFFGMDQLAITEDDEQLYVSGRDEVSIFDAATGALDDAITDAAFGQLTGITARREAPLAEVTCPAMLAISDFNSAPDADEFVQIQTVPNEDLLGLYVSFFDGATDESYFSTALTGSADASGLYTIGTPGVTGGDQTIAAGTLQNGPDAITVTKAFVAPGTNAGAVSSPFPGDVCASVVYLNDERIFGRYGTGPAAKQGDAAVAWRGGLDAMLGDAVRAPSSPDDAAVPGVFVLEGNYPNPFNPSTTIRYTLPEAADVRLVVLDALGREVRALVASRQEAGVHEVSWNGRDTSGQPVASGVYLYTLRAGTQTSSKAMLLAK